MSEIFSLKDVFTLVILAVSAGVAWGTVKVMIGKHEEDIKTMKENEDGKIKEIKKEIEQAISKQEKAIGEIYKKIEHLERTVNNALDHDTAERKFVTQKELQLRLENIYSQITSIDRKIDILIEYIKGRPNDKPLL